MMQAILERYHEEQVWSDKVSSLCAMLAGGLLRLARISGSC